MTRRYKYLGRKVKDIRMKGLDSPKEFIKIAKYIVKQARAGTISRQKARGRLLLLYRLTSPKKNRKVAWWSRRTRVMVRNFIKKCMRSI